MKKPISIPKLKAKALNLFAQVVKNEAYQREDMNCFTCGAFLELGTSNCQLGHYLSRGAYPGLTFHPDNSRLQCYRCNCHLHGNLVEFRERLINEIGLERVEKLEASRHEQKKWSRAELHEMIWEYNEKLRTS